VNEPAGPLDAARPRPGQAASRERLRVTFDEDAERYDRARPGYPPQLFEDLAELAGLGPGSAVLELGCGTGKATVPLVELVSGSAAGRQGPRNGGRVVGVELGPALAAVARRTSGATVVNATFESWPLPPEPFDLVLAATSWHWFDPEVRVTKSADALRAGGSLAIVDTQHVAGGTEAFFADAQRCYERFDPATPQGIRLQPADEFVDDDAELAASGRFAAAGFRRYEWELPYPTEQYIDLLLTYSGHRALPAAARNGLLDCIAELIDRRYGGRIVKRYLTQLRVAKRLG
jgi:SAM-dependent methyltransferase